MLGLLSPSDLSLAKVFIIKGQRGDALADSLCHLADTVERSEDSLLHEAAGAFYGHSSAEQAGEIATKAEVGKLYLIHYPTGRFANGNLMEEASKTYKGEVIIAKDFMTIEL